MSKMSENPCAGSAAYQHEVPVSASSSPNPSSIRTRSSRRSLGHPSPAQWPPGHHAPSQFPSTFTAPRPGSCLRSSTRPWSCTSTARGCSTVGTSLALVLRQAPKGTSGGPGVENASAVLRTPQAWAHAPTAPPGALYMAASQQEGHTGRP